MKKVFITGITGYIGSCLARNLLQDHEVYGLIREPLRREYIEDIHDRLRLFPFDGSYESIRSALQEAQPDIVYHMATYYTGAHGEKETPAMIQSNVVLGAYLLEAMAGCGCSKLVYASTIMAHYNAEAYRPVNLYAATKQALSDLLVYYTNAGLLQAVTLVISDTYGPGDHRPKVLNLIRDAVLKEKLVALSDGGQDYDVVYIDDVIKAFQMAGEQLLEGRLQCGTFQVIPESPLTLRETVEKMLQLHGSSWQGDWGVRPPAQREILRAVRLYPTLPGWAPQVPLEEGLSSLEWEC